MLKAEIGREQLSFASNNLSANFNACHRISIFLSSIPSAVFSACAGREESSRHMQDFERG